MEAAHEPHASISTARLTYFDGRGHGQRVRYALAGAGIAWEEQLLVAPGDVDAARPKCMFGQVPLLEIDGMQVVQSWACVRYIASKENLPPERAWVADACAEEVRDWSTAADFVGFGWSPDRAASVAKVRAATERYLPKFEAALSRSAGSAPGTAYLTGPEPCWADYQLLYLLDYLIDVLGQEALDGCPRCAALRDSLRALPRMQQFYASPHHKGLVDKRYMDSVAAAMKRA